MNLEIVRKKTVKELDIFNTQTEEIFDNITEMASKACDMPISFFSVLDDKTQIFKSKIGLDIYEISLENTFCKFAIEKPNEIFIVEDATKDDRFKENPFVKNTPNFVSYYGVPLVSKSGVAFGTLCVLDHQINKLSNNQKEILIKLAKTLENLVNLRSKSIFFDAYQLKIEHQSKNNEEFAYAAVHDLKAPVRAIDSFVKLLDKKYNSLWDKKDAKYVAFILQSTIKMSDLIADLLEYNKSAINKNNFVEFDLKELVEDIFIDLTYEKKDSKPILICEDMPTLFSSKIAYTVLFTNLIDNALKYQEENSIPTIEIQSIENEKQWIFKIKDNGIGIESDFFELIFKPLKRLHGNAKYDGTGLGLAICKKITEDLGGEITVDAVLGEGSTFSVKIPKE